ASGWHSCCLLIRILHDGFIGQSSVLGAPGIEEVRWLKPLRADETVTARATVLETRPSRSRPELGFVKFLFELFDSTGALLMTLIVSPMFARLRAVQLDGRPADDLDRQPDVCAPRRRHRAGHGSGRGASRAMKFLEDTRVGEPAQIGCHAFTA